MNAPRAWPNSSLSSIVSGTAAQLNATNGPVLRGPRWCTARATSSLPVPLSPVISTVASVSARRASIAYTSCITGLSPIMSTGGRWRATVSRSCLFSSLSCLCSSARSSVSSSSGIWIGLAMKSYAPARIAATAVSMLPNAVTNTIGRSGQLACARRHSSSPVMPGMLRSVMTASNSLALERDQRIGARVGAHDFEAAVSQRRADDIADRDVVVDEE